MQTQEVLIQPGHPPVELYAPDSASVYQRAQQGDLPNPYWARVWPAAIAMARFLLENNTPIKGKHLLELGAGLGLPSLVAAPHASEVLATDIEPAAVHCMEQSARHHGLQKFRTAVLDWNELPAGFTPEVVLMSDVNYAPEAFEGLYQTIEKYRAMGCTILLATPQRLVAGSFVAPLIDLVSRKEDFEIVQDTGITQVSVLVL
jgi:predicted nicotinamide N-methyase